MPACRPPHRHSSASVARFRRVMRGAVLAGVVLIASTVEAATGTPGNDTFFFQTNLGQLTLTMVNPYSGETVLIDEEKNINDEIYDGVDGQDTILFTNFGDAIFIADDLHQQIVFSIEIFIASEGDDVIQMADSTITAATSS
jgi:hypothetical protein